MVTIKDVAKLAGVSKSTVSRVVVNKIPVSKEAKERVMKAIKELNYHPNMIAKGLKEGKTFSVGLIIPNIRNPFYPALARGVEDSANKKGYSIVLCNTDDDEEKEINYINNMRNKFVDGLIICTTSIAGKHIKELHDINYPIVLLDRNIPDVEVDAIMSMDFKGAYEITNYLLRKGHRKIAFINGNIQILTFNLRYQGYCKALNEYNIPVDEKLVMNAPSSVTLQQSYDLMSELLNNGIVPSAVFATSDSKAIGAMKAVQEKGYDVPRDISIIGFGDIDISYFVSPSLTTYSQPIYKMGLMAFERLLKLMKAKKLVKPAVTYVEGELVERGSVMEIQP